MTMLKVANCPTCGKVYQKNIRNLCQDCSRNLDLAYDNCYGYLRDHRKATTEDLSAATGVSIPQITAFIKDNRLPLSFYPCLTYPCNSCQTPIRQHKLCTSCRVNIINEVHLMNEREAKEHARSSSFQIRR